MKSKNSVVTVLLRDLKFVPQHIKIPVKSTIVLQNAEQDSQMHEVTCVNLHHKPWRIAPGEKYYHTFKQPGKYELVTGTQASVKAIVEVVDRFRAKKLDRHTTKTAFRGSNPATPMTESAVRTACASVQPETPTSPSSCHTDHAGSPRTGELPATPRTNAIRSNLLIRHRQRHAASSTDSSDEEERAAIVRQRLQRKHYAQQLAARRAAELPAARAHTKRASPSGETPQRRPRAPSTEQQQTLSKPQPSRRRALQFARVTIKDFDFNHHQVVVVPGGTIEFVLDQRCPKLAEHQLRGESTTKELQFLGPVMDVSGCRKFCFRPAVEGHINVLCEVYPDMICSIQVEKPSRHEFRSRARVGGLPAQPAERGTGVFTLPDHVSQGSVGTHSRLDSDDETSPSGLCSRASSTCSSAGSLSPTLAPHPTSLANDLFTQIKRRATDADVFVCVTEYGFQPAEISVTSDDKIAFISVSSRSHLLSCTAEDSTVLLEGVPLHLPDRLVYLQFENAGDYTVQDEVFGFMKCKVNVAEGTTKCPVMQQQQQQPQQQQQDTAPVEDYSQPTANSVREPNSDREPAVDLEVQDISDCGQPQIVPTTDLPLPSRPQPAQQSTPRTSANKRPPPSKLTGKSATSSKPKKQWKLKQPSSSTASSVPSVQAADVGEMVATAEDIPPAQQEKQRVKNRPINQTRTVAVLHPTLQAVESWFANRMSEIELKLALHGFDTLPGGMRVPIIVV